MLYLPPYSPDLNPIEKAWAKLKQLLRAAQARSKETLDQAITEALLCITPATRRLGLDSSWMVYSKTENALDLEFQGDLSDLQQNLTSLLSSEMDKDDHCGERLSIQNATLVPLDPASLATISLHYERWGCVKVFGKQEAKKLIGGDAQFEIKLTPSIDENNTELRLVPEVGRIQADGSLGELLRSGVLGETIRNKVQSSITSALQKGANLSATLPPAVRNYVSIQNAEFKDGGSGNLLVVLDGRVSLTQEQVQYLTNQLKERIASR